MSIYHSKLSHGVYCRFGFTLVEILVAITVLTLGILAISQMTLIGARVNSLNKQRMYARVTMAQIFEDLNNLPSGDSLLMDDGDLQDLDDTDTTADHSRTVHCEAANIHYQARWNVANHTPEANIKTVRIHILWGLNDKHRVSSDLIKRM
jgi:prepilin-type N-terminal cleavage/methylation domain-containing protein